MRGLSPYSSFLSFRQLLSDELAYSATLLFGIKFVLSALQSFIKVAPGTYLGMEKMKKMLLLFAMSIILFPALRAQDVIVLKNGDELKVKVVKVGESEIEYKKWSNQDGPTYTTSTSKVFMVKYINGDKDCFNEQTTQKEPKEETKKTQVDYNNSGRYFGNSLHEGGMEQKRSELYLGYKKLSSTEVRSILNPEEYAIYEAAKNKCAVGNACLLVGWMTFGASVFMGVLGLGKGVSLDKLQIPMLITFAGSCVFIPSGFVTKGRGRGMMQTLADAYNNRNNKSLSYSFYPTAVKINTPTGSNYGFGLGLSVSF